MEFSFKFFFSRKYLQFLKFYFFIRVEFNLVSVDQIIFKSNIEYYFNYLNWMPSFFFFFLSKWNIYFWRNE